MKHAVEGFDRHAASEKVAGTIRSYPWQSVLVTFAVGALIGRRMLQR
jgi:ElaB/YqjD/DUF883 family membrane-anchored ribosome-binding protein